MNKKFNLYVSKTNFIVTKWDNVPVTYDFFVGSYNTIEELDQAKDSYVWEVEENE